jgi:hypothetical protein
MACNVDDIRAELSKEFSGKELDEKVEAWKKWKSEKSDFKQKYYKAKPDQELVDPISASITKVNESVAEILQSDLYKPVGGVVADMSKAVHKKLKDNDSYKDFTDTITRTWSSNKTIQQMKKYTWGVDGIEGLDDINIAYHTQHQNMATTMGKFATELDSKMLEADIKSDEDIAMVDDTFARSGLFGIANNGRLQELVEKNNIDSQIKELAKEMNSQDVKIADEISSVYTRTVEEGKVAGQNIDSYGVVRFNKDGTQTKRFNQIEALVALKALKKTDGAVEMVRKLALGNDKQRELFEALVLRSKALKELDSEVHRDSRRSKDTNVSRGNLIDDVSEQDWQVKAVTRKDMIDGTITEDDGWTVLRKPEADKFGIVYRKGTESMKDGGAGLNISYIKTGIDIPIVVDPDSKWKSPMIVSLQTDAEGKLIERHKLMLTKDEIETLGYYRDPAKSLIRGYAHKQMLIESQSLRDEFVNKFIHKLDNIKELEKSIKDGTNPIFVEVVGDKQDLTDMPQSIQDKYEKVDKNILSDVGGFKSKVSWVRKDVSQDVTGYKMKNLFTAHNHNKMLSNVKKLVSQAKTYTIILNPIKIGIDLISGVLLSNAKGASFQEIFVYTREAIKLSREMTDLRNELLQAKYEMAMNNNARTQLNVKKAEEKLAKHEFSPALAGGFFQSLGTDILSDMDTAQGIQVDIESMFSKLTKSEKKQFTKFNELVKKMANSGSTAVQMDAIYARLSDMLRDTEAGRKPADVLKEMSRHLKNIKSNKDMSKYLAEWVGAPNSSLVKFGAAMTVYADLIPRWIMYKHNINSGMKHDEAMVDARKALPDYTKNMPETLQWLSDLYVVPFPSFFTRVPAIVINAAKRTPLTVLEQIVFVDSSLTVYHSNPVTKLINGTLISDPTDLTWMPYSNMVPDIMN